jgi:hypothetical protein
VHSPLPVDSLDPAIDVTLIDVGEEDPDAGHE